MAGKLSGDFPCPGPTPVWHGNCLKSASILFPLWNHFPVLEGAEQTLFANCGVGLLPPIWRLPEGPTQGIQVSFT